MPYWNRVVTTYRIYVKLFTNMNGQVFSLASGLNFGTHLFREWVLKALSRLSTCAAASKHLRLIDNTIRIKFS